VAGPLTLKQGGEAFIARKAIFTNDGAYSSKKLIEEGRAAPDAAWVNDIPSDFWGFATMLVEVEPLFKEFDFLSLPQNYEVFLKGRHGLGHDGDVFYGEPNSFDQSELTANVRLPDGEWIIGIRDTEFTYLYRGAVLVTFGALVIGLGLVIIRERYAATLARAEADSQGRFLAAMSHEIRTPMNGIIGLVDVMEITDMTSSQRDNLRKISSSSKMLLRLVNDKLDYSKMGSNAMEFESESYDLHRVIDAAVSLVEQQAVEKGLDLRLEKDAALPQNSMGDAVRIQQVLVNLLGNAVKFTDTGYIKISAALSKQGDSECLVFKVSDTGIGISNKDLEKIFQPFRQADQGDTKRYSGTGLGLVISQNLARMMNGQLTVESTLGKGTTFTFSIPHLVSSNDSIEETESSNHQETLMAKLQHESSSKPLNILIVDDIEMNIHVADALLNQLGYSAKGVESGQEAIESIQEASYDVILMDRQMPNMDGLEATKRIRKITKSGTTPWIIAMTASAQEDEQAEYLDSGANDFLSKPVSIQSLAEVIDRSLKHLY
jgi:signal transduction histidine kinase/FixJ family two-component response regulator